VEHVARTTVVRADYCGIGDGVCRVWSQLGEQVERMAWASPVSFLQSAIEFPTTGQGETKSERWADTTRSNAAVNRKVQIKFCPSRKVVRSNRFGQAQKLHFIESKYLNLI
jgi:hypothetical protein